MRWKKLRAILQEHPYLLDDHFNMSMSQAAELQKTANYMPFEEMVQCAKDKQLFPAEAWVGVDAAIAKAHDRRKNKRILSFPVLRIRRLALVALAILLVAGYLTLTPSGRALAASVRSVIMRVTRNEISFYPVQTPNPNAIAKIIEPIITHYKDFDEAEAALGRKFMRFENDALILTQLYSHIDDISGSHLYAIYETKDNKYVSIYHAWKVRSESIGMLNPDDTVWEDTLSNGTKLNCILTPADGVFCALGVWDDAVITIYVDGGVDYEEMLDSIAIP